MQPVAFINGVMMPIVNALAGIMVNDLDSSDYVKTATVKDPSGNRVVFAELADQP